MPSCWQVLRSQTSNLDQRRSVYLILWFFVVCVVVTLLLRLGWLYVSTLAALVLTFLAAKWLMNLKTQSYWIKGAVWFFVVVSIASTFLIVVTYAYYQVRLDPQQLEGAEWLAANAQPGALLLADLGPLSNRTLKVYATSFAQTHVVLADVLTQDAYAENYSRQAQLYRAAFEESRSQTEICSLLAAGSEGERISYLWVQSDSLLRSIPCGSVAFENRDVTIIELQQ